FQQSMAAQLAMSPEPGEVVSDLPIPRKLPDTPPIEALIEKKLLDGDKTSEIDASQSAPASLGQFAIRATLSITSDISDLDLSQSAKIKQEGEVVTSDPDPTADSQFTVSEFQEIATMNKGKQRADSTESLVQGAGL